MLERNELGGSGGSMKQSDPAVVVEQRFGVDADTVWRAITEVDQMRQWFFENIPAFEAAVDFETQFTVSNEGRDFLHRWRVTEVVPRKRLVYDWRYEQYPGDSFVTFELFEESGSTRLRLTATVREDFPDDIPEFRRDSCVGGWEYFIQQRLKAYLEHR
jgi:uncharacterized protein YndB with AHSA1/START domain